MDSEHSAAPDVSDDTVKALGTLSEALEKVERARGHLYAFHQLSGAADIALGEAVDQLRRAGHATVADGLDRVLVGRNVLPGRWTFQIVEEYDDDYWSVFRALEADARQQLVGGRRHLLEAGMKRAEVTPGEPGHELTPADLGESAITDRG
ncbi:MAG: hypothetical protein ACR2LI_14120 [Propionibacteriaceae bacterium]